MTRKFIIILLPTLILCFGNCAGDFLDSEPSGYLSGEEAKANLGVLVNGLYLSTFLGGTGGTGGHDDFGQKSNDICLDLMSGDMVLNGENYGWFYDVYDFTDQNSTGGRAYSAWRYYYRLINATNAIFDLLGSDEVAPRDNADYKTYFGQTKVIRAYCYFYLVNLYQHRYQDRVNNPGVPVYRTQETLEVHGQSTVKEVYELIVKDLKEGVEALNGYDRPSKSKIDNSVAYSYLAYAYLSMGEYEKAVEAADHVINKFPVMTAKQVTESGFSSLDMPSWIWGVYITLDNTQQLQSFWGHMDYFTYSYAWAGDAKIIDSDLWASIPVTDVRKNQFDADSYMPIWKFYDRGRTAGGDRQWRNDLVYLRVEEMILIKAEALARLNRDVEAKAALKTLLDNRDTAAASALAAKTHDELMEAIYYNWRVEMWGEGKLFFALKRFGKTAVRGSNHFVRAGQSFPYNDQRMIFAIPEREVLNNPYLQPQN